jgi:flagellar protein FlgJ
VSIGNPDLRLQVPASATVDLADVRALRARAGQDAPEALEAVAQQFEALFIGMMLDGMRAATVTSDLSDSGEMALYQQMFDREIASGLAAGGGLGLARLIVEQLSRNLPEAARGVAAAPGPEKAGGSPAAGRGPGSGTPGAASPGEFIREVLPHARRAAAELGVHPMALVAQAALETGWGGRLPRRADGEPSNNLFGIKADAGWDGARVAARTLEFERGVMVERREQFRAYRDIGQSFADYVRLIRESPRYAEARSAGADPLRYAEALQAAGYATDPAYAAKIRAILGSEPMAAAWAALGDDPTGPMT